jgi:hypothetical protein
MLKLSLILIILFLAGCSSTNPESHTLLKEEISKNIRNGMPIKQALIEFDRLGFKCNVGTSVDPNSTDQIECIRNRHGFIYTCIQRAWLDNVSSNGSVRNLEIHPPNCAGL